MPRNKDFKRLVRARMEKTGESYTAALAQLLKRSPSATNLPDDYADRAGMSDEAVAAKTDRTWPQWVQVLDAMGAAELPHREIARQLREEHGLSGWWSQAVTVGYELIRGLREVGQRRSGDYEASKTRTVHVPVAELYRAFTDEELRARWLPGVELEIRTLNAEKSARAVWPDGTAVEFRFVDKGVAKSALNVEHRGLPDATDRQERKEYWGERLEALKRLLEGS